MGTSVSKLAPLTPLVSFTLASFYLIKRVPNLYTRLALTVSGASAITYFYTSYQDLPPFLMSTMLRASLLWMCSIRLCGFMCLPEEQRLKTSLPQLLAGWAWFFFPILKNADHPRPRSAWLIDNFSLIALAVSKIFAVDIARRWLIEVSSSTPGGGETIYHRYWQSMVVYVVLYTYFLCGTSMNSLSAAITSLVTRDKYKVLSFTDWPILGTSPREVWSKRFNRLVGTLLHESVFTPLRTQFAFSPLAAALGVFFVSGALHAHVAVLSFNTNLAGAARAFSFFAIHGAMCALEKPLHWNRLPTPVALALTHSFFLLTAPLYPGFFIRASPQWMVNNLPEFPLPEKYQIPIPRALIPNFK